MATKGYSNDDYLSILPPDLRTALENELREYQNAVITQIALPVTRDGPREIYVSIQLMHPALGISRLGTEQVLHTDPLIRLMLYGPSFHRVDYGPLIGHG